MQVEAATTFPVKEEVIPPQVSGVVKEKSAGCRPTARLLHQSRPLQVHLTAQLTARSPPAPTPRALQVHLTQACWKTFKQFVIAKSCKAKRRVATPAEKRASGETRKGKARLTRFQIVPSVCPQRVPAFC